MEAYIRVASFGKGFAKRSIPKKGKGESNDSPGYKEQFLFLLLTTSF